jgi:hypothetical protein
MTYAIHEALVAVAWTVLAWATIITPVVVAYVIMRIRDRRW